MHVSDIQILVSLYKNLTALQTNFSCVCFIEKSTAVTYCLIDVADSHHDVLYTQTILPLKPYNCICRVNGSNIEGDNPCFSIYPDYCIWNIQLLLSGYGLCLTQS